MNTERTERDLRELLVRESRDVADADRFAARLHDASASGRLRHGARWAAAAAAVVVLLLSTVWVVSRHRAAESGTPAAAGLHTLHLSLRPVPYLQVTAAQNLADREVLEVSYTPNQRASYEGGAVTLYAPGAFRASTFLPAAVPLADAYYGAYPYTGVVGSVTTLAWRLGDGRWVTAQNFLAYDTNAAATRALEVRVKAAVIVR